MKKCEARCHPSPDPRETRVARGNGLQCRALPLQGPGEDLFRSGDVVRIVMTDVTDRRPVEDVVCSKAAYLEVYREAELAVVTSHEPLGREDEPFAWVDETRVAPWRIDVLRRA